MAANGSFGCRQRQCDSCFQCVHVGVISVHACTQTCQSREQCTLDRALHCLASRRRWGDSKRAQGHQRLGPPTVELSDTEGEQKEDVHRANRLAAASATVNRNWSHGWIFTQKPVGHQCPKVFCWSLGSDTRTLKFISNMFQLVWYLPLIFCRWYTCVDKTRMSQVISPSKFRIGAPLNFTAVTRHTKSSFHVSFLT